MLEEVLKQIAPFIGLFGDSPLLKASVIIVLSLLLARIVAFLINKGIRRIAERTASELDDLIIDRMHRPLFWTVLFTGFLLAAMVARLPVMVLGIVQSLLISMMLLVWSVFALKVSRVLLVAASRSSRENSLVRPQTLPLFTNLSAVLIVVLAIYLVFQAWNIDMTAWLASAGIVGIAVGFAAKDTLANLFSGVFIMADSPYKIGDYVVIDNTVRGMVTHIGIRSTRVLTRQDVEVTIPNSVMGNSMVINESGGPHEKYRIAVKVGVAYGSDIDKVLAVLQEIAENEPEVCTTPEPKVRFRSFGASSLDLELLGWIEKPELRGRVIHLLNTEIYKRFLQEGIEIPYSKHDLYIKQMPSEDSV